MKVYEKIVFNIHGEVVEEQSFEYDGPVARCEPVTTALSAIGSAIYSGLAAVGGGAAAAPTVGSAVAGGLTVLTAATGVASAVSSGIQNRGAMAANAEAIQQEAEYTRLANKENARRRRVENEDFTSTQIAKLGASGLDFMGSPLDLLVQDAGRGEMAARDIEARGTVQAASKEYEARLTKWRARQIGTETGFNVGGKLIGGASKVAKTVFGA